MQDVASICRMQALSQWSRETHLMGLKAEDGQVLLDHAFFSCCGATGIYIEQRGNLASWCGLTSRVSRITDLCRAIARSYPREHVAEALLLPSSAKKARPQNVTGRLEAVERWRKLHLKAIMQETRGRLIADASMITGSTTDTWVALATLIWHNDVHVLFHVHGAGQPPITQWLQKLQGRKHQRFIVVIEQVKRLWEAGFLDEMEQVIAFCSRNLLPLWLVSDRSQTDLPQQGHESIQKPEAMTRLKSSRFAAGLQQRLHQYQKGGLEQWLSASTVVRLQEVCDLPTKASRGV